MSLVVSACARNAVVAEWNPPMIPPTQSPLRRFVIDGLRQTLDSYTRHTLPLHRFAWELHTRIDTLAELTALPQWRPLAALRAAQHTITELDAALRALGRDEPTPAETRALATAVATLRDTLDELSSDQPTPLANPGNQTRGQRPRTPATATHQRGAATVIPLASRRLTG